jgi:hypothetical protein
LSANDIETLDSAFRSPQAMGFDKNEVAWRRP